MKRLLLLLAVMTATVCIATITLATTPPTRSEIRDIRDQLPPSILPPFSSLALILFIIGSGVAVTAKIRTTKSIPVPHQAAPYAADTLALLKEACEKNELPAAIVCERLAGLIGACLVAGSALTMTSTEVISAANEAFPEDVITAAKALLELCDQVRFGGFHPDSTVIAQAIDDAQLLLQRFPGTVP